jgi:hypothetical protein
MVGRQKQKGQGKSFHDLFYLTVPETGVEPVRAFGSQDFKSVGTACKRLKTGVLGGQKRAKSTISALVFRTYNPVNNHLKRFVVLFYQIYGAKRITFPTDLIHKGLCSYKAID